MSKAIALKMIDDVKPYKSEWRIRAKLLHSWRQNTSFGGDSLEMVLADETVCILYCLYLLHYIFSNTSYERYFYCFSGC